MLHQIVKKELIPIAEKLLDQCSWDWVQEVEPQISPELLQDYQLFLLCKREANDIELDEGNSRLVLSPTVEVDRVWHEHMLRPQEYFVMNRVLVAEMEGYERMERMPILQHYPKTSKDSKEVKQKRINRMLDFRKRIMKTSDETKDLQVVKEAVGSKSPEDAVAGKRKSVEDFESNDVEPGQYSASNKKIKSISTFLTLRFVFNSGKSIYNILTTYSNSAFKLKQAFLKSFEDENKKSIALSDFHLMTSDGQKMDGNKTPRSMKLSDGDEIQVMFTKNNCTTAKTTSSSSSSSFFPPTESEEKEQPAVSLTIFFRESSGERMYFKIQSTTPMGKLMNAYTERKGVTRGLLAFYFDGCHIRELDTFESLDMSDNDQIDVFVNEAGC